MKYMLKILFGLVALGVVLVISGCEKIDETKERFQTIRQDALIEMCQSDIQATLKAIPARIFAEGTNPTATAPSGFANWGEWMIDTAVLDMKRWRASGNGIEPILDGSSCGMIIWLDTRTGTLRIDPNKLSGNKACKALALQIKARSIPLMLSQ